MKRNDEKSSCEFPADELVTAVELGARLKMNDQTVRKYKREEILKPVYIGIRQYRFWYKQSIAAIEKYYKSKQQDSSGATERTGTIE